MASRSLALPLGLIGLARSASRAAHFLLPVLQATAQREELNLAPVKAAAAARVRALPWSALPCSLCVQPAVIRESDNQPEVNAMLSSHQQNEPWSPRAAGHAACATTKHSHSSDSYNSKLVRQTSPHVHDRGRPWQCMQFRKAKPPHPSPIKPLFVFLQDPELCP